MSREIEVCFKGKIILPDEAFGDILKVSSENRKDLGEYAGKYVFVEQIDNGDKGYSNYHNGEYFCVRHTPATLYCIKPEVGYGGHTVYKFNLIGKLTTRYEVISSYTHATSIKNFVKEQTKWIIEETNREGKRQWVESVYSGAKSVVRQVEQVLEDTCQ